MANIKLNELSALNLDGSELFDSSESFMVDVSDCLTDIVGGQGCRGGDGIACQIFSQVNCNNNSVIIICNATFKSN